MKKQFLLIATMLLSMVAGAANEVEIDGIYYNLVSKIKEAEVANNGSGYYKGNVVIPASVTYNGVEYSVTSIERGAFAACPALTSITIPNSMKSIGEDAFQEAYGLTSVHISDLAAWCKIVYIGDGRDCGNPLLVAHHLFLNGEEIKDLVIPNSVTSIGGYAFAGCHDLTSVTIPNSVISIGDGAFI